MKTEIDEGEIVTMGMVDEWTYEIERHVGFTGWWVNRHRQVELF